MMDKNFNK